MAKRSKSSERWLHRQRRDYFVKRAHQEGRVSRAHYKLRHLDRRFKLIGNNFQVLELGAAPGGWTDYLGERLTMGRVIAVDPLPVTVSGTNVVVLQGRIGEPQIDERLSELLQGRTAGLDLVLSDMAPNISGVRVADQARSMELVGLATDAAFKWLKRGGAFVVKIMQGDGVESWLLETRRHFAKVNLVKPAASRPDSRENYGVARGFLRNPVVK
ncbi:MAG: RlmE family RNA methyltransferase [Gammaproteobacteria bacterium]|nr:RlmE family RNA methyltransferase [Gammaproteobacteria bacterium]